MKHIFIINEFGHTFDVLPQMYALLTDRSFPHRRLGAPASEVSNHDELMSNFFAQADALAYGKTAAELEKGRGPPSRAEVGLIPNPQS